MKGLNEKLEWVQLSIGYLLPELILATGIIFLLITSLLLKDGDKKNIADYLALIVFSFTLITTIISYMGTTEVVRLFSGMLQHDVYSTYFKILFNIGGILTVLLSWNIPPYRKSEYYALLLSAVLGAHLLVCSNHFTMVFLSIELI